MKSPRYQLGFQSQEKELSLNELAIKGQVPGWLKGSLIRTAPSKFEVGNNHYRHWFDGLAMLHKFSFEEGKVSYASKFLESNAYLEARKKNRIVYGEFGTDPCRDLFQKVSSFFLGPKNTDNGCVNINLYGNELTATTETPQPISFDLGGLTTKGHYTWEDEVVGHTTTVHPHYGKDGTLFSFMVRFGYKSKYLIYAQKPYSSKREIIASIPTDAPAYMHSLGMTENFLVLTEFPLVVNPLKLRFGNKPFIENYKWKPERGTKIHLIRKDTGDVQTFKMDPFFAFHHANAFEENNAIVFDLVRYEDAGIIDDLYLDQLRADQASHPTGKLWRFRIEPEHRTISHKIVSPSAFELPRINYKKANSLPYQYVFGVGNSVPGNFIDNITKVNVRTGKESVWHEKNCYPGEPVFVAQPEAREEDEGLLLSIVLDAEAQSSFLLILDARDLKEVARAYVPHHITFGFHGQYVNSQDPEQVAETIHS